MVNIIKPAIARQLSQPPTKRGSYYHVYGSRRLHCPEGAVAAGHKGGAQTTTEGRSPVTRKPVLKRGTKSRHQRNRGITIKGWWVGLLLKGIQLRSSCIYILLTRQQFVTSVEKYTLLQYYYEVTNCYLDRVYKFCYLVNEM